MSQTRGALSSTQSFNQGSITMLPFFLLNFLTFLPYALTQPQDKHASLAYPLLTQRYNEYGWNRHAQHCYTPSEIALLEQLQKAYSHLLDKKENSEFFKYVTETHWQDWWQCTKPLYQDLMARLETGAFTLPNREKQDPKNFPVGDFSNRKAQLIANWLAERSNNQPIERMNDPVMLMFEELKNWFLTDLTQQECRSETLDKIADRISYLKNVLHLIPDFGLDKPHLIELQRSLGQATTLVKNCIANKELPQLLADFIRRTHGFETYIFNILHFLLINEKVEHNFSEECLTSTTHAQASPICTIYKAAQTSTQSDTLAIYDYQGLHQFYNLVKINDHPQETRIQLQLRSDIANEIHFASFVTEQDKLNYVETIATLDALINVRKILEKFHGLQTKLGTYLFAINYVEKANELASNYIKLINKIEQSIKLLAIRADEGHEHILRLPEKNQHDHFFKKNLRTLETLLVAKGTTVVSQLEQDCAQAAESMEKYQQALRKLATDAQSGAAYDELKRAMQELDLQMGRDSA